MTYATMARMVSSLATVNSQGSIIPWAAPVPFFGRLDNASVATVGINPSALEFVANDGRPLSGPDLRLPTLASLGISSWAETDGAHLREMVNGCLTYFLARPYDRWFGVLERVLARMGVSYYGHEATACHLDIVPFATASRWSALPSWERRLLVREHGTGIAELVRSSSVETLVLNGRGVVEMFASLLPVPLEATDAPAWNLSRATGHVQGMRFQAVVSSVGGLDLGRRVRIIGFNHNLQSSFGVTASAAGAIGSWLRDVAVAGRP